MKRSWTRSHTRLRTATVWVVFTATLATAAPALAQPGAGLDHQRLVSFLERLQDLQSSGLVPLVESDTRFTTTYTNAMAALVFARVGRHARARRVLSALASQADDCPGCACQGGLQQFRDALTARPNAAAMPNDFWIGDNAWLLAALRSYERQTGDPRYRAFAERLEAWFQCLETSTPDPGIYSGFRRDGSLMEFRHAEGSIDVFGALRASTMASVRNSIKTWIDQAVWTSPGGICFERGSENRANLPTDHVSWGVLALGRDYDCLLRHAEGLNYRSVERYTIEAFDREPTALWTVQRQGDRPSIVVNLHPAPHGEGQDLVVSYDMAAGDDWFLFRRDREVDFEATSGFRYQVWLHGNGSGHQFEIKLYNRTGEVFWHPLPLDFDGWRLIEVPYRDFVPFGSDLGVPLGRVAKIEFAINTGGRGADHQELRIGRIRYTDISRPLAAPAEGFSAFQSERNWLFLEGTAQMATAYCAAGERTAWSRQLTQLRRLIRPAFDGQAAGLPGFLTGAVDGGEPNAVATAWLILAGACFDPF